MTNFDDQIDVGEISADDFGLNNVGEVSDEMLEAALEGYAQKPQIVKILASKEIDDLKMLSEVPRRMVLSLTSLTVVIEARKRWARKLIVAGKISDSVEQLEKIGLFEIWLKNFLLLMRGVDRKFLTEPSEAMIATERDSDGEEVTGE